MRRIKILASAAIVGLHVIPPLLSDAMAQQQVVIRGQTCPVNATCYPGSAYSGGSGYGGGGGGYIPENESPPPAPPPLPPKPTKQQCDNKFELDKQRIQMAANAGFAVCSNSQWSTAERLLGEALRYLNLQDFTGTQQRCINQVGEKYERDYRAIDVDHAVCLVEAG